jgi:hypothetical protein
MMERDDEPTQLRYARALNDQEVHWDECCVAAIKKPYDEVKWREVDTLSGGQQKRLVLESLLRGGTFTTGSRPATTPTWPPGCRPPSPGWRSSRRSARRGNRPASSASRSGSRARGPAAAPRSGTKAKINAVTPNDFGLLPWPFIALRIMGGHLGRLLFLARE